MRPALGCLLAIWIVLSSAAAPWTPARAATPSISGFRPADIAPQLERETKMASIVSPDSLRKHLRLLTERPHVAGTLADYETAEYVRGRLEAYGWRARIEAVPVYLNYPRETLVELVEPGRETLEIRERGLPGDKDAFDADVFEAFHGYGASGEVTAPVVYANYLDKEDIEKLAGMGIDLRGKVVLARYGKIFRGLKVRNAERAGAAAVVLYSDPADDGFTQEDAYPRGQARPHDAIQRGSVQFLSESPGDPTTPGWPSRSGGKRLSPAEARGIPKIPSLPIAWAEAEKILSALEGPAAPKGWQGGLPLTYHLGEGPAKLHVRTVHDYAVRPIWNVIATLEGRERPDLRVVCGNHRDAWTYGGVDPNSGTIAMLEMARGIGAVAKTGWRPRRSIVLCSWDGEEYGLLGSTEWCEAEARDLTRSAVAYLNVDAAVSGKDFRAGGCHALRDVLVEAMTQVRVGAEKSTAYENWRRKAWSDGKREWARKNRERRWRGESDRPFEVDVSALGSGSDYTAFVDHLGVPALDMRFGGLHGTYHSIYDNFEYVDRVVDPGFAYHTAMAELWGRVALRLAEAEALPLRYSRTARFVIDHLQEIEERIDEANATMEADGRKLQVDLAPLRSAAARLMEVAAALESRADLALHGGDWPAGSAEAANAALMSAERAFLGPGLPGRPWFRHEIYAPGLDTGYAAVPLPRLGQALTDKDPAALQAAIEPIRAALERATAALAVAGR